MNHDEFREKLLASFPGLRQHIHRLTTSSDDADDLLQETLLKAFVSIAITEQVQISTDGSTR